MTRRAQIDSELTLAEMLADPITQALMRADGVLVSDVLAIVSRLRRRNGGVPSFRKHEVDTIVSPILDAKRQFSLNREHSPFDRS